MNGHKYSAVIRSGRQIPHVAPASTAMLQRVIRADISKDEIKGPENVRGVVTPATPLIYNMALDEGIIKIFMDSGFCVLNPTCGACLGMSSGVLAEGEVCASTTNRNFNGRMGKGGMVHLMSPFSAAASALTGVITDPRDFLR